MPQQYQFPIIPNNVTHYIIADSPLQALQNFELNMSSPSLDHLVKQLQYQYKWTDVYGITLQSTKDSFTIQINKIQENITSCIAKESSTFAGYK